MRDWRGIMHTLRWSEFEWLERVERGAEDQVWFKAGKISGAFPLDDLVAGPNEVVDIINQYKAHTSD